MLRHLSCSEARYSTTCCFAPAVNAVTYDGIRVVLRSTFGMTDIARDATERDTFSGLTNCTTR